MESGYKMITEFDNLMSIKTGETALLLEEIQKSETWLSLQDEEKKLLAKFLIKTNYNLEGWIQLGWEDQNIFRI